MLYQLQFFDRDSHIERSITLSYDDDDAARTAAAEHANGQRMQLWFRARQVEDYPAGWSSAR